MDKVISIVLLSLCVVQILGHGILIAPVGRSSLWRVSNGAPVNENDDEIWCGSPPVQYNQFYGQCGVCGDIYSAPHPQDNENGGLYGTGQVVQTYVSGANISATVFLTENSGGAYEFDLCVLDDPLAIESGEECFQPLYFSDGSTNYTVNDADSLLTHELSLPEDLVCSRCVLRWEYIGASNPRPRPTFRNCADITIIPNVL